MDLQQKMLAQRCLAGSEDNTMTFPEIVATLTAGGFEGYGVDFRRRTCTYYRPDGESVELPAHKADRGVSEAFDTAALEAAIREAQRLVPGYTYEKFCAKARSAGCAGYMVSFSGRRAVYFGRTGEVHTERFPAQS
jgi:uncharacterized protein YbcV (DUF1398 family)